MSYKRVIPRDLFNEANLLKCLGQLYLNLEKLGLEHCLIHSNDECEFIVHQEPGSGDTYVLNIYIMHQNDNVYPFRPLNSRDPWPLYIYTDEGGFRVFNDDGSFSKDMMKFVGELT